MYVVDYAAGYEEEIEVPSDDGLNPDSAISPTPQTSSEAAALPPTVTQTRQRPANYGAVVATPPAHNRSVKRYRISLLILLAFEWSLVMFFSVVVWKVRERGSGGREGAYLMNKLCRT